MRIIGLDLGERRIGIAISDENGLIAQALDVLERRGTSHDQAFIKDIVKRYGVERVVVGLPKNMDGSIGPAAAKALAFADDLRGLLGLPVDTWDERLSTVEANRMLLGADLCRARRKKVIDKIAAAVILEGYLASLKR